MFNIHKEGYLLILLFCIIDLILFYFSKNFGLIGLIAVAWCVYFFRDPVRISPIAQDIIVSPADGVVQAIVQAAPPAELEMGENEMTRISIFLNIFNVHVNRVPISGKIEKLHYRPGKFFNASLDKASVDNERQSVHLITKNGNHSIAFVQIAGLIARRIVCDLSENQEVITGNRYGIIRFGSRVDIYLPDSIKPEVLVGQTMIGGETVIARIMQNNNIDRDQY